MNWEKLDFLDEGYYVEYYEKAIEEDVRLLAQNSGFEVVQTTVSLDEEYRVEQMELQIKRQQVETIVIGDEMPEEREEILALRDKIASYYQIGADKISIRRQ